MYISPVFSCWVTYENSRSLNDVQKLWIMGLLVDNPSLYLGEICQKVHHAFNIEVSTSTICRLIYKHGFTRKKIQQIASQRSSEYRAEFLASALMFSADKFVWIDESGCDKRDQIRKLGYALQGEHPVYNRFHRGQRISVIAAMFTVGVISTEIIKGTVDGGNKFTEFVQGKLIPEMMPFDGNQLQYLITVQFIISRKLKQHISRLNFLCTICLLTVQT